MAGNYVKNDGSGTHSPFGEAHTYFVENVLPNNIQAHKRSVHNPTSMIHNKDQTFLLIKKGTGTLTVNGIHYPIKPGTLVSLGPFHIYCYTPDEGQTLEIIESRMNSGTYMYLVSNPYFKMQTFDVPSEPPVVYLQGLLKDIAYSAMEGILTEHGKDKWDGDQLCFCYMTELFGIVADEMGKEKRKKEAKNNTEEKA